MIGLEMVLYTSYFAKSASHPNAVSIAGKAPGGYHGREYKKLAPPFWLYKKYKEDWDSDFYTEVYIREVLGKLDPQEVLKILGPNAIILCYETPEKFCHRFLVAKWLQEKTGIEITEI